MSSSSEGNQKMRGLQASTRLLCGVVMIQLFAAQIDAQGSRSPWQTLSGDAPRVIARGGFSGMFPDSSLEAYQFAIRTSVAGAVQWCDVQLTKDGVGICFPDLNLANASNIQNVYPNRQKSYPVNGVPTEGWFTIDFSLRDLKNVSLSRGIYSRLGIFDQNRYAILTVQNVSTLLTPVGLWLNFQHDAFYEKQNISVSSFLLSASRTVSINYISSPEVNFLRKIAGRFGRNGPVFVFQFLGKEDFEPITNLTYGSILNNLTFVKMFASGILVPKSYILPLDDKQYLLPHTSLVQDAHKAGLEVYVSGFANDVDIAFNYSFDPVSEYLSFMNNGDFSVDGVVSDFPNTASASVDCFSQIGRNATKKVDFLIISKNGASGDYPGCTDLAYENAIKAGADVIDCSVQMSNDGTPFCASSINLTDSTMVAQTPLIRTHSVIVPEFNSVPGIYSFSLTWPEIKDLTPAISNPFLMDYGMSRNPKEKNSGKLISLSEFLNLAKNSTSISGVLISVENAAYLREEQGLDVVKAILETLTETGYSNGTTTTKIIIQSTNSSVLVDFKKQSKYETVYKIGVTISDISDSAIEDIKKFANAVVINKHSVFPVPDKFLTGKTNVVERLQKSQLPVYVELFRNEFDSQPYDFFSDATIEINAYINGASINGTITEFPFTAARYRRNGCLGRKEIPPYMLPVQPGSLLNIINPLASPTAQASSPVFTDGDITKRPLPPVIANAPNSDKKRALNKAIPIVLGSVAGVVLFLVLLTLFLCFIRVRKTRLRHQNLKALIPLEHYTYAQVKRITKSFAEVLGTGGFGIVYRGTFGDGRMVAVKVLKDLKGNGEDFINEVASISRTSHLNIVSLLGFCSEGSKRAIIYEFLENGSLDKFISGKTSVNMDWTALYRIALGVARGLEYLHHSCKTRIVHFDIKPQNVLLDDNFCPKISDFGLAKLCEKKGSILSLLDTRGTVGYIAPEMISRVYGNVSHKSDVYSYGMLVLEMIGARNKEKANHVSASNTSSMYFPEWVYRDLESGKSIRNIENGINSEEDELAKKMTLVGLWCIQPSPPDRPPMNRVVEMMEGSLDALEVPPRPVFQIPNVPLQQSSTFSEDISGYTEG